MSTVPPAGIRPVISLKSVSKIDLVPLVLSTYSTSYGGLLRLWAPCALMVVMISGSRSFSESQGRIVDSQFAVMAGRQPADSITRLNS